MHAPVSIQHATIVSQSMIACMLIEYDSMLGIAIDTDTS